MLLAPLNEEAESQQDTGVGPRSQPGCARAGLQPGPASPRPRPAHDRRLPARPVGTGCIGGPQGVGPGALHLLPPFPHTESLLGPFRPPPSPATRPGKQSAVLRSAVLFEQPPLSAWCGELTVGDFLRPQGGCLGNVGFRGT